MPKKVLALKITPQTYKVYEAYPGIEHLDLKDINNNVFVRDETLPNGIGYFTKLDFDKYYRIARGSFFFTKFTECFRVPPPMGELPEIIPPVRVLE